MTHLAVDLVNLTKRFADLTAVNNLSLGIPEGQILGLVGPNGAGKTTTLAMLMGFLRPSEGNIHIFCKAVTTATAHQLHDLIGYVAGDMALFDHLSGEQYLTLCAHLSGRDDAYYASLLRSLRPTLKGRVKHLSRGNRQKIALVAALQHHPRLLIMDEPTSGLDPLMQEVFLNLILDLRRQGVTVLMSSHMLTDVAKVCDRAVFMRQGQIIEDQLVDDIERQAGKVITLKTDATSLKKLTHKLPKNLEPLKSTPTTASYRLVTGDISEVVKWLDGTPLRDLSITDVALDDIFDVLYERQGVQK